MNDDFLHQHRQAPPEPFGKALYQQLSSDEVIIPPRVAPPPQRSRWLRLVAAVLIVAAAGIVTLQSLNHPAATQLAQIETGLLLDDLPPITPGQRRSIADRRRTRHRAHQRDRLFAGWRNAGGRHAKRHRPLRRRTRPSAAPAAVAGKRQLHPPARLQPRRDADRAARNERACASGTSPAACKLPCSTATARTSRPARSPSAAMVAGSRRAAAPTSRLTSTSSSGMRNRRATQRHFRGWRSSARAALQPGREHARRAVADRGLSLRHRDSQSPGSPGEAATGIDQRTRRHRDSPSARTETRSPSAARKPSRCTTSARLSVRQTISLSRNPDAYVLDLAYNDDGSLLAISSQNYDVSVWDTAAADLHRPAGAKRHLPRREQPRLQARQRPDSPTSTTARPSKSRTGAAARSSPKEAIGTGRASA